MLKNINIVKTNLKREVPEDVAIALKHRRRAYLDFTELRAPLRKVALALGLQWDKTKQ